MIAKTIWGIRKDTNERELVLCWCEKRARNPDLFAKACAQVKELRNDMKEFHEIDIGILVDDKCPPGREIGLKCIDLKSFKVITTSTALTDINHHDQLYSLDPT